MARPLTFPEGSGPAPVTDVTQASQDRAPSRGVRRVPWIVLASVVVTFIVVNIAVVVAQPYLMRLASYDFQYTTARVADYYFSPRPNVIFMGSSRALEGFVPALVEQEVRRQTGVKVRALNLAITGSSVELNYLLLKNVISEAKKPEVIVYGFSEFELDPEFSPLQEVNLPYYTLLFRLDDFARFAGSGLDDKIRFVLTTLCPLCRDATLIRNALSIAFNPDDPSHKYFAPGPAHQDQLPGGMSLRLGPLQGPPSLIRENYAEYSARLQRYHTSKRRIALLNSLLTLARQRGIHMVVVNMPVTTAFRGMWSTPAAYQDYDGLLRRIVVQNHATFADLYRADTRTFAPRDFLDLNHLDLYGAEVVSRIVARQDLAPFFRHRSIRTP